MALTYSRDSTSSPLRVLEKLIREVREGTFSPDPTRSGRLKKGTLVIEQNDTVKRESSSNLVEISDESDSDSCGSYRATDSSSESGDDCVVAPRKLYNRIAVPEGANLWQHDKLRTLHLMKGGHINFFFCGRKCSDVFRQVEPN